MKLSELVEFPKPEIGTMSVEGIWYDGRHYLLGDDGDTLVEAPEPVEFALERRKLQNFAASRREQTDMKS